LTAFYTQHQGTLFVPYILLQMHCNSEFYCYY